MLNKNDPLIGAVQEVMKKNHAEREAIRLVNEKFGVHDRKALPHEKQSAWDAAYQTVLTEGVEALGEDYDSKAAGRKRESDELAKMATSGARTMKKPEWKKNWKKMSDKFKDTADRQNREATTGMRKKDALGEENDIDHPNKRKLDVAKPFGDLTSADFKKLRSMKESDVTSPSSMGIKKPDYATGTPDYANKGPQMVNRAAKTSAPAGTVSGTVKEAVMNKVMKKLKSVNEGAKVDRMVRHIKSSEMKAGKSPEKAEDIAWATANKRGMLDNKNKKVDEGFNNRHNSSVNASVEEQVVAEIAAYPGTPAGLAASSSSMQTAERQRRMGERRSELAAQRQQGGDVAPRQQGQASPMMGQGTASPPPKSPMRGQGTSALPKSPMSGQGAPRPLPKSPMAGQGTSALPKSPMAGQGTARPVPKSPMSGQGAPGPLPKSPMAGQGTSKSVVPKPNLSPTAQSPSKSVAEKPVARPAAVKPAAAKAPRTLTPVKKPTALQRQAERSRAGRDAAVTGPGGRRG